MGIFELRESFKAHLEMLGQETGYYGYLRTFCEFVVEKKIDFISLSYDDYCSFIITLKKKYENNTSVNNYIFSIRSFYYYLENRDIVTEEILERTIKKIPVLKVEQKIKDSLSRDELEKLLSKALSYITRIEPLKVKAVIYFMFYTGLRKGELLRIKRADIDLELCEAIVRIPNKSKCERKVFFPKFISELLGHYFHFEVEKNNAFNISISMLAQLFVALQDFCPKKNISPHTMRRSFAMMLARQGIDIRIAQKLLGHKDIQTTLIYYDPDVEIIRNIYNEKIK